MGSFLPLFQIIYELNAYFNASCTDETPTTLIPSGKVQPPILVCGIITLLNPNLAASCTRCSILATRLTSPVRPTSPIKQSKPSTALSLKLEAVATMILKSTAGSVNFTPPATLI